jgi:hypothetical protein
MTQEITAEQAPHIHDLESYKAVTGAKRFKRTAEEMQLGLSPEEALKRRLAAFDPNWLDKNPVAKASVERGPEQAKARQFTGFRPDRAVLVQPGDIVIRIRAAKGVDKDYLSRLPTTEIVVEQDNFFYGRVDDKLAGLYEGETDKFFQDLIESGMGELIDHPAFKQPEPLVEPEEVTANVNDDSSSS